MPSFLNLFFLLLKFLHNLKLVSIKAERNKPNQTESSQSNNSYFANEMQISIMLNEKKWDVRLVRNCTNNNNNNNHNNEKQTSWSKNHLKTIVFIILSHSPSTPLLYNNNRFIDLCWFFVAAILFCFVFLLCFCCRCCCCLLISKPILNWPLVQKQCALCLYAKCEKRNELEQTHELQKFKSIIIN